MLFNSYTYLFIFLPIVFILFTIFKLTKGDGLPKLWLILSSCLFYSFWGIQYLPLLLCNIAINYVLGRIIRDDNQTSFKRKFSFVFGILFNLTLLGFFKYSDFFIKNINVLSHANTALTHFALPIAISFITFQQISYLCDCNKKIIPRHSLIDHALFCSFFPKLISGPIVRYNEMLPQFMKQREFSAILNNLFPALLILSMGIFKKVIIADQFAVWADFGFDHNKPLSFLGALSSSLSYTLQIYFDFSGYTDMAIGSALLFGVSLPVNFDSPYKAVSIQDFWRKWHMTLSFFFRDYLYIPLGGNRKGFLRSLFNLLIISFICGLWHGPAWTFVIWGILHGMALIIHALWRRTHLKLNKFIGWFITFNFVNVAWIFFRANTLSSAMDFLAALAGLNGFYSTEAVLSAQNLFLTNSFKPWYIFHEINGSVITALWLVCFLIICILFPNTNQIIKTTQQNKSSPKYAFLAGFLFIASVLFLDKSSEFIYARF